MKHKSSTHYFSSVYHEAYYQPLCFLWASQTYRVWGTGIILESRVPDVKGIISKSECLDIIKEGRRRGISYD